MKKVICIVMIAALLALSSAGIAEVTGPAYLGPWICGRAILDITDEHPGYRVEISWAGSAAEATTWTYHCPYELVDGSLVSEPTGVMVTETYSEDGEVAKSVTAYEDGQATFTIGADGKLPWADAKENAGADMTFEASTSASAKWFFAESQDFKNCIQPQSVENLVRVLFFEFGRSFLESVPLVFSN